MSPTSSVTSVGSTPSINAAQRRTGITPSGSHANTPYSYANDNTKDYLHKPVSQRLAQYREKLQEHADSVVRTEHADHDAVTPRYDGRRGSCVWVLRSTYDEDALKFSRNPMMPERIDNTTPPSMEELVRRTTNDDSDSRRSSVMQSDMVFSRPPTTRSSTSGIDIDSLTCTGTQRLSVSGPTRNMTEHIPDIRTHHRPTEKPAEKAVELREDEPGNTSSVQSSKKTRKLSFQLPSGLKIKPPFEILQKPSPVIEEPPNCGPPTKGGSQDTPSKSGGLAARRQVKLELTLPIGTPNLPDHNYSPHGIMSSITPSRPRSPKTPWIHEKQHNWSSKVAAKSAPIVEEDQAYINTMANITLDDAAGLMPGRRLILADTSPLTTDPAIPLFVRPPQKIRDRCYISRPTAQRNKSGGPDTSESDFGSTPDGYWTPEVTDTSGMTEQELRTRDELSELARTARRARSRRWPWNKSKASGSDEKEVDEREKIRHISVNIFKRSNRFPDVPQKEKKPPASSNLLWRRKRSVDKPPLPSASLANMPVPPTFVPPGLQRVQTPLDAEGEVRGKLADFFFDNQGFAGVKRKKPKASPGGYWDSNAVLMSMETNIGLTDDEDEAEGPEGRPPAAFYFGPVNDTPGPMTSPGLMTGPDGHLTVKGSDTGAYPLPSPETAQDSWYHMHYGDHMPHTELLTAAALKEADERRKFEWLVPEHLPNSPLCPLHVKYKGPSKGLCYWHGRKSNGWGVEPGRDYISHPVRIGEGGSRGWDRGELEVLKEHKKKRRLVSLSSG